MDVANAVDSLANIRDPWELLRQAEKLSPGKMALSTSGQLTGVAIILGAKIANISLAVFTIDTWRLLPETLTYLDQLEHFFGIKITRVAPETSEVDSMIAKHGEFLFFDSKAKQEYCCEIRKVRPNQRHLRTIDIWVSGLRRDQSEYRKDTPLVQPVIVGGLEDQPRKIIKISPLANWDEAQTRAFLAAHQVPIHPLLKETDAPWFYESLGCRICTTPQAHWEGKRAGRWRWFKDEQDKKECGLHLPLGFGGAGV